MNAMKRVWVRSSRWIIGGAIVLGTAGVLALAYHTSAEARAFIQSLLPAKQAAFDTKELKALGKGRELEVPNKPPN